MNIFISKVLLVFALACAITVAVVSMPGCAMRGATNTAPATDLQNVAKSYEVASATMDTLQDAVMAARSNNTISAAGAANIAKVAIRVDKGLKESIQATRAIAKLDDPSRASLRNILDPILKALDEMAADPAILGITNELKRNEIRALISSIQTTMTATKVRLAP